MNRAQLKQVIEEQFEGLVNEQRPRRGIETASDTPVLPKIEPRAAETEGPPPPPEVKADVVPPVTKPDPYAEPKWDPEAMQRHHSEAALYDDLRQWGGKGRFKHHAPSALSTRDIEGVKSRWHAGMELMSRPDLTDAQKRKVFRMAMSKAGQIGGEGTWDRQRSMGHKGGERYHRLTSMPFSNLITGLSGGQRKELHKNLAKSGYWKKMHPSNPIRQDFEKSVYYKKPTKRRRRKKKRPAQKFQSFVATDEKTGKPVTLQQARKRSWPNLQESQLKQMIEEQLEGLLSEQETDAAYRQRMRGHTRKQRAARLPTGHSYALKQYTPDQKKKILADPNTNREDFINLLRQNDKDAVEVADNPKYRNLRRGVTYQSAVTGTGLEKKYTQDPSSINYILNNPTYVNAKTGKKELTAGFKSLMKQGHPAAWKHDALKNKELRAQTKGIEYVKTQGEAERERQAAVQQTFDPKTGERALSDAAELVPIPEKDLDKPEIKRIKKQEADVDTRQADLDKERAEYNVARESKPTNESQLKQMIEEQLEGLLNEERDWLSWLPDTVQNLYSGPEEQTLHHGIEWFDRQPGTSQRAIFDDFRNKGGRITSDGPDKEQWNDWLWKYYVPKDVKQGNI